MIVGCYCLHLYCRYSNERECPFHLNYEPEIFGVGCETGSEARQQARKHGWVLDLSEGEATCPACAKRKGH